MARIAAEALVERLVDWGVDTIFGLPGDGIDGIMEGLRRHQEKVSTIERYAHLVGGCRMAAAPTEGVVDADLRTFAVPNLYITDGSVLPTQGSANPALTIMALAARAAEHLGSTNSAWAQ